MPNILVFGDSITWGAWDKEGGWVQRLRTFLEENYEDYFLYNLGISGNTTDDLLKRFEFEAQQRIKEEKETIFIIAIGANDSQFIHSKNNLRTPPERFKENIQKLIDLCRKFSSKIIFVGLTPVDETKTLPISWDTDKSYKNEYIRKYNEIIKTVCEENKINFVDIFRKFKELNYQNSLDDGLHPNSAGHQKIFEIIKEFLIKNKII